MPALAESSAIRSYFIQKRASRNLAALVPRSLSACR